MRRSRVLISSSLSTAIVMSLSVMSLPAQSAPSGPATTGEVERAQRLLADDEVSAAVRVLEAWLESASPTPDQLLVLADAYGRATDEASIFRKRGLAKKHKETLERALQIDASHVDARSELADFLYYAPGIAGGNREEAGEHLVLLGAVSELAENRVRARHALSDQDYPAAARYLTLVTHDDPDSSADLFTLGVVLNRLARHAEAMAALVRVVDVDSTHARAHYQVGRLAALHGLDLERGVRSLKRYLELEVPAGQPEPKHAHWRLGQILVHLGRFDEARSHFETALTLDPGFGDARDALERIPPQSLLDGPST